MHNGKEEIRRRLLERWQELWPQEAEPPRPPIFEGHNRAAERLRRQPEYVRARAILVLADPVLLQVRINALQDGKTLLAATPGLKQGLVRINPGDVALQLRSRLLRGGSLGQAGQMLRLPQSRLGRIDLVVAPVVAVDRGGVMLGDGRGLCDVLCALLKRAGALSDQTPVAVLAAPEQIVPELPAEPWDLGASLVISPEEVLRCPGRAPNLAGLADLPHRLAGLPLVKALWAMPAQEEKPAR
ncbi:MAG: 5-formyltetrahydrofolate cyclo-ligase [Pseudomonadota bacterium]